MKEGGKEFRITVTEVRQNATAVLKQANRFNSDPPAGLAYLLVKVKLEYLKGPQNTAYRTSSTGHSVMAAARMWGPASVVIPEPKLGGQDIFPGAVVDGWLDAYLLPSGQLDAAVLSFGKPILASTGGTWLSLSETANTPPALPELTASPNARDAATARQRDVAIPFDAPALLTRDGQVVEIQVTDVVRNATREVKQANQFNDDPLPGQDYLLIKVKARYISGPQDQPWKTPATGHSVFAQNRMWGNASVVEPEPKFGGVDLYPGGEHEGWLSVVTLPKNGMDEAVLSYGKGLLGGDDTWFALR